jgi:hypothetical protein
MAVESCSFPRETPYLNSDMWRRLTDRSTTSFHIASKADRVPGTALAAQRKQCGDRLPARLPISLPDPHITLVILYSSFKVLRMIVALLSAYF